MKYTTTKGFTLIELLMVIAIIGILASVVLASITSARNKASDKAIVSNMLTIRSQAQLYYEGVGAGSYGTTTEFHCASGLYLNDPIIAKASAVLQTYIDSDHVVCTSAGSTFAIAAQLKSTNDYYCLDSMTNGKIVTATSAPNGLYGSPTGTVVSVSVGGNPSDTGLCN